jgi:hypothetical protein
VDGKTYPFRGGSPDDVAIIDFGSTPDYHYVVGRNDAYPGVHLSRAFYFLNSGRLMLVDEATSTSVHTYSQLFHLSHRLDPRTVAVRHGVTSVVSERLTTRLAQATACDALVHRGHEDQPDHGIVSEGFNVLHPTTTVEYQQRGRSVRFVTVIAVDDANEIEPLAVKVKRRRVDVRDGETRVAVPLGSGHRR